MNKTLRLLIVCTITAFAILIFALGMARHHADLLAPFNLILFVIAIVLYFVPSMLAFYRNCHATPWITLTNAFLGWTIFGWFIALGWAASGRVDALPTGIHNPPPSPVAH